MTEREIDALDIELGYTVKLWIQPFEKYWREGDVEQVLDDAHDQFLEAVGHCKDRETVFRAVKMATIGLCAAMTAQNGIKQLLDKEAT